MVEENALRDYGGSPAEVRKALASRLVAQGRLISSLRRIASRYGVGAGLREVFGASASRLETAFTADGSRGSLAIDLESAPEWDERHDALGRIEWWFRRHGLSELVLRPRTREWPFLLEVAAVLGVVVVLAATLAAYVLSLLGVDDGWVVGLDVVVIVAWLGYILVGLARRRGARRSGDRPPEVGWLFFSMVGPWMAAFVAAGFVLGRGLEAILYAAALMLIIGALALGLLGLLLAAAWRAATTVMTSVRDAGASREMFAVAILLFLSADTWELLGDIRGPQVAATLTILGLIGAAALGYRCRSRLRMVWTQRFPADWHLLAPGSSERALVPAGLRNPLRVPRLHLLARIGLLLGFSMAAILRLVRTAIVVTLAFVTIGAAMISAHRTEDWAHSAHPLWSPTPLGLPVLVTEELLRVSGVLAAIVAVYYVVVTLSRGDVADHFLEEEWEDVRTAAALWSAYHAMVASGRESSPPGPADAGHGRRASAWAR